MEFNRVKVTSYVTLRRKIPGERLVPFTVLVIDNPYSNDQSQGLGGVMMI